MTTSASSTYQAPPAPSTYGAPQAPGTDRAPDHPLAFARGLALALPISLLFWIAVFCVAWGLWRG